MLNAREDEEQTQTMHWGTWSPGQCSRFSCPEIGTLHVHKLSGPSESVCIEVDQMERKAP